MTAPSKTPTTYEAAYAAAEALVARSGARAADPVAAVSAAADQTASIRDSTANWAKTAIRRLWEIVDPYDPKQVQAFTVQAAGLMESAQTAAARVAAAAQAQQLAALGIVVDAVPSNPVDVRASGSIIKPGRLILDHRAARVDYAGPAAAAKVTKAEMSTQRIFERPAKVFRYAKSTGASDVDAGQLALKRIDVNVDDNVMLAQRHASQEVIVQAVVDLDTGRTRSGPKIIGYRRVIHPELSRTGTCGMCIAASDRIYHVAQLMPIHQHCHCTICAVTDDYDPADDLNAIDLSALYKDAGGTSSAALKRTRYKEVDHGELAAVLVPQGKYRPRTQKSKVRVGGTALLGDQPAQAEVARHQIEVLEDNLVKMRADGISEDSPKFAYHDKLIAKLREQLSLPGGGMSGGGGGGGNGGGGAGDISPDDDGWQSLVDHAWERHDPRASGQLGTKFPPGMKKADVGQALRDVVNRPRVDAPDGAIDASVRDALDAGQVTLREDRGQHVNLHAVVDGVRYTIRLAGKNSTAHPIDGVGVVRHALMADGKTRTTDLPQGSRPVEGWDVPKRPRKR